MAMRSKAIVQAALAQIRYVSENKPVCSFDEYTNGTMGGLGYEF